MRPLTCLHRTRIVELDVYNVRRGVKAIRNRRYGPPEALRLQDVAVPAIADDQLLVRVRAASVNPIDWHMMRGRPLLIRLFVGLRGPVGDGIPGVDVAGTVEAVGAGVTELAPGDEVFGSTRATFAEYTVGRERNFVTRPANLPLEQAAALPGAGVTALLAVRDHGLVQPGQKVLVNGASGGVGTFAVQIAKSLGAQVTGVCSTANVGLVRSLGADAVVDYSVDDFTRTGPYDVIVDTVSNRSLRALRRALLPTGALVTVGGGGLRRRLGVRLADRFVEPRLVRLSARVTKADMLVLKELVETGKLAPAVGRTFELADAPEAIRYVESRHARGKVLVMVSP
jgi:NADPH:quinone reductase-like Zn-dependent oxidoreductase